MKQGSDPVVLDDPVVKEIAEKHNATPAQVIVHNTGLTLYKKKPHTLRLVMSSVQVCISFLLHRGIVVIPKSVNPKRIGKMA